MRAVFLALSAAALVLTLLACGGTKTLSEEETRQLLRQLPYRFEFRPVADPHRASGAVAGTAFGPHHTVLHFGISLGDGAEQVPLGPHTDFGNGGGTETAHLTADDTLFVNGEVQFNPKIKTRAQWNTATRMHVDIEEKLCKAIEGHPCPI